MAFELPPDRRGMLGPEWLAESIRITAFKPERRPAPIWQRVMKSLPAEVTERPGSQQMFEAGDFAAGGFVIHQQEGRTDFVYTSKTPISDEYHPSAGGRPHIGPLGAAITALFKLVSTDADIFDGAVRLAFGPVAFRCGSSNAEVNSFIQANSAISIGPQDTDVVWSFNRAVAGTTFPGQINRLVKWNTIAVQQFKGTFPQQFQSANLTTSVATYARFELDINTITSAPLIALEQPLEIFDEMIRMSVPLLQADER